MSPPIRDGSGSSIGSIRLGDGSEISEVRTGAGDVLFSAAPPDSQISFSMPSKGSNTAPDIGGVIQTSQSWPEFQARFDSNTNLASDEELVLADANETELEVIDASNGSPGDIFTFNTALDANEEYRIYGRTPNNNARDDAFTNSVSFPITSNDGNLEITAGYASNKTGNTRTNLIQHISGYGNLTL